MPTPYDRIRAAWQGPDHPLGIHHVVEQMAAEGITRSAIDEALGRLLDEVRAAGADDDTEEIINSVGDRIHGWCHRDAWILFPEPGIAAQPPANGLPTPTDRPVSPA